MKPKQLTKQPKFLIERISTLSKRFAINEQILFRKVIRNRKFKSIQIYKNTIVDTHKKIFSCIELKKRQ